MINNNEIAAAIRELSQALSKQDADIWHSVGFWGIVIPLLLGIVTLAVTQISAHRKFKYDVTIQCIENFRKAFEESDTLNEKNVSAYLGVIDEQLFYFRRGWIYREFVKEWLRNMVYTLPVFYYDPEEKRYIALNGELLTKLGSFFGAEEHYSYIFPYRNIRNTILIDKKYKLDVVVSPELTKSFENMAHNDASINLIINAMKKNLVKQTKEKTRSQPPVVKPIN